MPQVSIVADSSDNSFLSVSTSYATARNASSAGSNRGATTDYFYVWNDKEGSNYGVERAFLTFATGAVIPRGAVIQSATLTLKTDSDVSNNNSYSMKLVDGTPANDTSLVNGDFDQVGSTEFGTGTIPATNTSFNVTVNSTGIANIAIGTGNTSWALRLSGDIDNSTPTAANRVKIRSANHATSADRPTLTIEYSLGGSFLLNFI